jgi:eukaryotic-like serine/threonine-protein kinase
MRGAFMLNRNDAYKSANIIAGRYRLLSQLRHGGMSEVYLAQDQQAGQQVAVKLVQAGADPDCLKRLQRESRLLRSFSHPSILPVLDAGEYEDTHYLVMPYMQRGNLRERLARGRLSPQEAGHILGQLAAALDYAHARGIVHRDIKPSNILLDDEDEQRVYLADFGLAKAPDSGSDITQTGMLIGTPEYMAPELAEQSESASSDIYALGVLLYQMLTGRLPFNGATPLAVYWKHIQELPPPPSWHNPALPAAIESVILRALAKDPQERFESAGAMKLAYEQALDGQQAVVGLPTLPHPRVSVRQQRPPLHSYAPLRKTAAALAAFVFLVLPLSLGFMLSPHHSGSASSTGATAMGPAIQLVRVVPHDALMPPALNAAGVHRVNFYSRPQPPSKGHPHKHHKHGDGGD